MWLRSDWDVSEARPLRVSLLLIIMVNTHQTSLELVPPRLSRSDPVLTPAPLPSQCHGKSFHRILVGVVSLHALLSVGGFIFLYHKDRMQLPSSEKQESTNSNKTKP